MRALTALALTVIATSACTDPQPASPGRQVDLAPSHVDPAGLERPNRPPIVTATPEGAAGLNLSSLAAGEATPVPGGPFEVPEERAPNLLADPGLNACGEAGPTPDEICNGVDDDCDGRIDEGYTVGGRCTLGPAPQCAVAGIQVCTPDGGVICAADLTAVAACSAEARGALAVGSGATCAVRDGALVCWGGGPLTDGRADLAPPAAIEPFDFGLPIERVAVGKSHGCVIDHAKAVRCWGEASRGALGVPADGRGWIAPEAAEALPLGFEASDLALGEQATCAVGEGRVTCWGANDAGILGVIGEDLAVAPGGMQRAAALDLGMTAVQVTLGDAHACALSDRGKVKCWGANDAGQLGLGDRVARTVDADLPFVDLDMHVIALSAADRHTCALGEEGRVKCWGSDAAGALNGVAPEVGSHAAQMGASLPVIPLPEHAIALATSSRETCAVGVSGALWCWGDVAESEDVEGVEWSPVRAPLVQISLAADHACGQTAAGGSICWGANSLGQLGQGDDVARGPAEAAAPIFAR